MITTLYLLRHGTTAANLEKRFAGRTEEPVHPHGIPQIERVGQGLVDKKIIRIYTGPLRRTRQSAEILREILKAPVCIDNGLNEIAIPHWDGLTKDEIRARFGPEYPTWLESPHAFHSPGCEPLAEVQNRAVTCAERMLAEHQGESVVVISHLIILRCLALHYLGMELNDFRKITINNGDLTQLCRAQGVDSIVFNEITDSSSLPNN